MHHLRFKPSHKLYLDTRNSMLHPMLIYSQGLLAAYLCFTQTTLVHTASSPVSLLHLRVYLYELETPHSAALCLLARLCHA